MIYVTAAIIARNGRILLMRRAPGQSHAGLWEFPGGKIEQGETPQECLARELKEECDVTATVGEKVAESIYTYAHGVICLIAYVVTIEESDVHMHAHDACAWVAPDALTTYTLSPADIPLAEEVARRYAS